MACAPSFLEASLLLQWWCLRATVLLSRSFGGAVAAVCPDDAAARVCHSEQRARARYPPQPALQAGAVKPCAESPASWRRPTMS